jgi:hypothetical protein
MIVEENGRHTNPSMSFEDSQSGEPVMELPGKHQAWRLKVA